MKKLMMIAALFTSLYVSADEGVNVGKELDITNSYIMCGFYGSVSGMDNNSYAVPAVEVRTFQYAALKHYKATQKDKTSDTFIVDYAEYVAAQQAVLWDRVGDNNNTPQKAKQLYRDSNCSMLFDNLK